MPKKRFKFFELDPNLANHLKDCSNPLRQLLCKLVDCSKIKCEKEKPEHDTPAVPLSQVNGKH